MTGRSDQGPITLRYDRYLRIEGALFLLVGVIACVTMWPGFILSSDSPLIEVPVGFAVVMLYAAAAAVRADRRMVGISRWICVGAFKKRSSGAPKAPWLVLRQVILDSGAWIAGTVGWIVLCRAAAFSPGVEGTGIMFGAGLSFVLLGTVEATLSVRHVVQEMSRSSEQLYIARRNLFGLGYPHLTALAPTMSAEGPLHRRGV